jgi:hypothetical protein
MNYKQNLICSNYIDDDFVFNVKIYGLKKGSTRNCAPMNPGILLVIREVWCDDHFFWFRGLFFEDNLLASEWSEHWEPVLEHPGGVAHSHSGGGREL